MTLSPAFKFVDQYRETYRQHHVFGAGALASIGFKMSIFITDMAFIRVSDVVNDAKMAILLASTLPGLLGVFWQATWKAIDYRYNF